jgi:hypothetical protein
MLPTGVGSEGGGAGDPLLLLMLVLVQLERWVDGAVVVHRPVFQMSTFGRSCHNLPLVSFLMDADCIIHNDDIVDKL